MTTSALDVCFNQIRSNRIENAFVNWDHRPGTFRAFPRQHSHFHHGGQTRGDGFERTFVTRHHWPGSFVVIIRRYLRPDYDLDIDGRKAYEKGLRRHSLVGDFLVGLMVRSDKKP